MLTDPLPESTPDTRRLAAAALTGQDPDRIRAVSLQLDTLRKQGILVDLTIGGVGMFTRAATWLELGILDDDVRRARLSRGQKYLIPEDQVNRLRSLETRFRQLLEGYSYRITGFAPYRWIPFTAYLAFRDEWDALVIEFDQAKTDILARYDEYVSLLASDFTQVAANAWKSIRSQGYDGARIDGIDYVDQAAFTAVIVSRALAKMPSREKIAESLAVDYTTALVYGEQDLAADQLAAERTQHQIELERDQRYAQRQEAYLQASILQRQAQHQVEMQDLEREQKLVQLEAMRKAEAEHARQRLAQMASPFDEIFTTLRRQIAADVQSMLESIRKNGYVRGKIAEKGRGLLAFFDLMAAHDDHELRGKLQQLQQAIGPIGDERPAASPERDAGQIVAILDQINALSHTAAQDLAAGPSRFSLVEI